MTETTPLSGKKIWSSGLSASTRICSRRQGTCSRRDISFLRSREGKASKSRLRGNSDKTFILFTRSPDMRWFQEGSELQLFFSKGGLTAGPSGSVQKRQSS